MANGKAFKGNLFLLKAGDGKTPEVFTTVAGLRGTGYSVNGEEVNVTDKDSGGWRELLDGGGETSVTISADGVYRGASTQVDLRARAMNGTLHNYQIDNGEEVLEGTFQVTAFEQTGDENAEQAFSVTLESSGEVEVSDAT